MGGRQPPEMSDLLAVPIENLVAAEYVDLALANGG